MKKRPFSLALSLIMLANTLPTVWAAGPNSNGDPQWQQQAGSERQEGRSDNRAHRQQPAGNDSSPPAQPQRTENPAHRQPNAPQRQPATASAPSAGPGRVDHFAFGGHDFRRGQPAPAPFRGNDYRVNDWRARGLPTPPRGHHWSYIDGRYVLIAAATGVITSIILNSALQH